MLRVILFYGAVGALICGSLMVAGSLQWASGEHMPDSSGLVVGYLTQLIALTAVFLGIKTYRDNHLGGVIKFLPGFLVGLAINAVATLGWVFGWEIVLATTNFDVPGMMHKQMLAEAQAKGASAAELQKVAEDAANFAKMYANPLIRWGLSFIEMFPVGVLVSLLSALVLRNSRFLPARGASA